MALSVTFATDGHFTFTELAGVTGSLFNHADTRNATLSDDNTSQTGYDVTFAYSPDPQVLPGSIHVQVGTLLDPIVFTNPGGASGPVIFDFSVLDKNIDFLRQGQTLTQHILVTITDESNPADFVTKDIQVDITGANDKPVAHVDFLTISENTTTATKGVLGNDTDPDLGDHKRLVTSSVFSVTSVADPYLTKAMVKAVNVNFLNNALPAKDSIKLTLDRAFQGLATGENAHIVVKYTMVDDFGATSASELQVTVIGSNDAQIVGTNQNDLFLYGEKDADKIFALAGNDVVFPRGGNDTILLGAGHDTVVFDTKLGVGNKDTILDFSHVDDTIKLSHKIFTKLAVGPLKPANFHLGPHATHPTDYIVYNQPTGALIYDVNGSAAGGEVQFATLSNHPIINNTDFVVI
jgi:VCBS repeat-containing protein